MTSAAWDAAWRETGASTGDAAEHRALLERYAEPHRRYHTLRHLEECLARWARVRDLAEHPGEVEIALWYHDAVYDPRRADNEARSAELAREAIGRAGLGADVADRVAALVLATRHDAPPPTPDAALLVDVDLGILAADLARFDEYEREVREEYAWVPDLLFRHKRREVLEGFLARGRIFTSDGFPGDEQPARTNLTRSLASLGR